MSITLGNAIKAARLRKGMTQATLAQSLGITRAAVGQWEAGTNEPSAQNLFKISSTLDLDITPASQNPVFDKRRSSTGWQEGVGEVWTQRDNFDVPVTHVVLDDEGYVLEATKNSGLAYVRRFSFFDRSPNIFAIIFSSNALSPKYEPSDIAYVDPDTSPAIGEYGVFSFKEQLRFEQPRRIARRVVFADENRVILTQFKPSRQEEVLKETLESASRIIPEWELARSRGKSDLP